MDRRRWWALARRVFATGWAVLLAGSVVAALAMTASVELVGRVLQGAGSALTLLMMLFAPMPRDLAKTKALYGAAAPAGGRRGSSSAA